jgi:hypothetical protein
MFSNARSWRPRAAGAKDKDMDSSQIIALNILFVRRKHWRAKYVRAQRDMDDAAALRREHGGPGPSDADFDELARLMMKSERADTEYLQMLGVVARGLIDKARRDASDGRVKAAP